MKKGYLILEDGSIFEGILQGYPKETSGEVVFTTGMVGYTESMTDPSYSGQILTFTYPMIGNYGIFENRGFESEKIHTRAVIASEICQSPSHVNCRFSIDEWCHKNKIPFLSSIDTRTLTEKLRNYGTLKGGIFFDKNKKNKNFKNVNENNLVESVSCSGVEAYSPDNQKETVLLYDCGVKKSIIDSFLKRNVGVIRVPWNYDLSKLKTEFSGVVISNGPGDPQILKPLISKVNNLIKSNIPILGICLGNQILALALGAKTYKLKFGHRSQNQPVMDLKTEKCYVTSQNHGFAVDLQSLPQEAKPWFKNLNDDTCEGIYHKKFPVLGVQFHPEANPGPTDTGWVFDLFLKNIKDHAQNRKKN